MNILSFILLYNYVSLYIYFLLFLINQNFVLILETSVSNKDYWFIYLFIYECRLCDLRF